MVGSTAKRSGLRARSTKAGRLDKLNCATGVAPIAGPMFGPAGRVVESVLRREMREWRTDNPGGLLWLIRPNHAIADLAHRPGQLFDADRARRCYDLAYKQGAGILQRWELQYGDTAV